MNTKDLLKIIDDFCEAEKKRIAEDILLYPSANDSHTLLKERQAEVYRYLTTLPAELSNFIQSITKQGVDNE